MTAKIIAKKGNFHWFFSGFNPAVSFDFATKYYSAHSSGNHILVNNLKHYGCGDVKGFIMMSPVDGIDPWGMIPSYCIKPGEKLNFEIPTLVMAAGWDWDTGKKKYLKIHAVVL